MSAPIGNQNAREKAQAALAQFAYAEEFARRQKHRQGWMKAAALVLFAAAVAPAVWALFSSDWRVRLFWLLPAGLGLTLLRWLCFDSKGSPRCPHCHEDITECGAAFCHLCGEAVKSAACARCGADQSWTAGFQSLGHRQPILYCPGCGVYLNSTFYRYEQDSD